VANVLCPVVNGFGALSIAESRAFDSHLQRAKRGSIVWIYLADLFTRPHDPFAVPEGAFALKLLYLAETMRKLHLIAGVDTPGRG
jgi:hypothetical protein